MLLATLLCLFFLRFPFCLLVCFCFCLLLLLKDFVKCLDVLECPFLRVRLEQVNQKSPCMGRTPQLSTYKWQKYYCCHMNCPGMNRTLLSAPWSFASFQRTWVVQRPSSVSAQEAGPPSQPVQLTVTSVPLLFLLITSYLLPCLLLTWWFLTYFSCILKSS